MLERDVDGGLTVCQAAFCCCNKIPQLFNLKRRKVIFGSRFQPLMLLVLLGCDSRVHQEHVEEQSEKKTEAEVIRVLIAPSRAHPQ